MTCPTLWRTWGRLAVSRMETTGEFGKTIWMKLDGRWS
jgi:hypothetical protein